MTSDFLPPEGANWGPHPTGTPLGPQRLTGQRWRFGLAFLGALAFVALSAWLVSVGGGTRFPLAGTISGLLGMAVFGCFAVGIAINIVHPPHLDLDEHGLSVCRPPFGTQRDAWTNLGPVFVWASQGQKLVTFESPAFTAAHPWQARLNRRLGAQGAALQPRIGGLKAEELAYLLNAYREAYRGRPLDAADPE